MDLFQYTYDIVRQIPDGKISTYGAVAKALGDIRASRAVGRMMNQNPDANSMPCYKIVYSDGKLGGFGLGADDKIRRLKEVNIKVQDGSIVDFDNLFFNEKLKDDFKEIKTVAGFDVAYPKNDFDDACGAMVVMDYNTKEVVEEKTVFLKTFFPYIPTYLGFRELPFIEKLIKKLDSIPTVLMIDGNGVLHPYEIGLATHAGIVLDMPCIGVAKNLLIGNMEDNYVNFNNSTLGYALFSSDRVKKPVYISVGHKISLETSIRIVKHFSEHKIPEPIRRAHMLARSNV